MLYVIDSIPDSVLDALKVELFEGISEFGPVLRNAGPKLVGVFDRYGSLNLNDNRRCDYNTQLTVSILTLDQTGERRI